MREIKFRAWWKDTMEKIPDFMEEYLIEVLNNDPDNPFIFSQFTGLLDKNGKEIFEGDVVKEGGLVSVIEWANERYCYRTTTGTIGLYGFCGEIIGNIYENPELISPKKDSTPNRI